MTKTIRIPSRLNPASEPPDDNDDVIIKLDTGHIIGGYWNGVQWRDNIKGDIVGSEILGWAAILQK